MKTKTNTIYLATALFAFACFALSPQARGVCQEGCLTDENTVLGEDALLSNTTGFSYTAIGKEALYSNTTGNFNTATGDSALHSSPNGSANTANGVFTLYANTIGSNNTATARLFSCSQLHRKVNE